MEGLEIQSEAARPDLRARRSESTPGRASRYGRARLWLGVSAVGTLVSLAACALAQGLAGRLAPDLEAAPGKQALGLVSFVLLYAVVQFPFDVIGGYLLPRWHGRSHPPLMQYLGGLARGVAVHTGLLLLAAVLLMYAGRYAGIPGTVVAGLIIILLLLAGRVAIASVVSPLELKQGVPGNRLSGDHVSVALAASPDEGFTGAIVGVFRPSLHLLPLNWGQLLGDEGLHIALRRRSLAVLNGGWRRGRLLAVIFTLCGLTIAAGVVGHDRLGSAAGTIELSLLFTIWSFLGLLTLPTPSRWGVSELDERLIAEGCSPAAVEAMARGLDDLQDGERERSTLVETIFHPIPSVGQRLRGLGVRGRLGFWDAARTSIYLGQAGLGLLGRAVHCNCGRPGLWVFLPTD